MTPKESLATNKAVDSADGSDAHATLNRRRYRALAIVAVVVVLIAGGTSLWWWTVGRWQLTTSDAYVGADMAQVSALTVGTVKAVAVYAGQRVRQGDLLVELDESDAQIALAQAEASLAKAVRSARGLAGSALVAAQAGTGQALAQSDAAGAQVNDGALVTQPDVALAAAGVHQAALALARTRILAPVDGVAGPRAVQLGERVAPGTPVMNIVPLSAVWIDANFKETGLAALRVGQPVSLTADAFGSEVHYTGKVAGIAPATGSALSLLPAQNATGNWIKVVQRVPVRIWLEPGPIQTHPLQVGLSMSVTVDLHDQSGPRLGLLPQAAQPQRSDVYDNAMRDAEARVTSVIAANRSR